MDKLTNTKISVIIPTLNEENNIGKRLKFFTNHKQRNLFEVIVVDGVSTDRTIDEITSNDHLTLLHSKTACRAVQMNLGAAQASHDILYFVHADVILPDSFFDDIMRAVKTYKIGGYRYQFDSNRVLLKLNAFCTRFPMAWCGGGDQTLFITKELFQKLDGFDERYCVMEDFDLVRRSKRFAKYHIIPKNVIVSARKYDRNGYLKVQIANLRAFKMFRKGADPGKIRAYYKEALSLEDY
ncbi:MAG: TIGR04283 family arsenosugar biosynthesis glycosyltransferase [Cyclobacteriaceae bacterium]